MLGLAALLRVVNLGGRPLWYDEAFAVLYAEKPLVTMLYGTVSQVGGAAADVHPLFYYTLLHSWMELWGQSPAAVRSLSVLLGIATVWVVYHLAGYLYGRRVGLVAAVVLSISPFHIYYSQETRMYALLGLAAVTTTYCFVRAWSGASRQVAGGQWQVAGSRWQVRDATCYLPPATWWLAFAIAGVTTLYAHNLGAFFLAAVDGWVVWAWWRGRRLVNLRPVVLSHLLMLALFAPWLLVAPGQWAKIGQAYWVTRPGLAELIQTLLIFHFAYDNQALPTWLLPAALFFSLLLPAVLVVAGGKWQVTSGKCHLPPATCHTFLLCLTLLPILLTFLVSQERPVYVARAMLPSAIVYYILAAAALVKGSMPRPVRWGVLLPAVAIVVISLVNHYTYARFPRSPFDQVAAYLAAQSDPAEAIVHSNKLTFLPTHYYGRRLEAAFLADAPGSPEDTLAYPTQVALGLFATPDLATAVAGRHRVWFVILARAVEEYQAAGRPHPHLAWLEGRYEQVRTVAFNDVLVYEYVARP
ncbi:MAG: glycosyltransferase family 39 protein [Chloroflexota bacterium]